MSDTEETKTSRNGQWLLAMVTSVIALVALMGDFEGKVGEQDRYIKWSVSAVSVTVGISTLGVFGNLLLRDKFVGTAIEGGLATILIAMWAAVMPAIQKPANELANSAGGAISNANLYFFSWGALIATFLLFFHYLDAEHSGRLGKKQGFKPDSWAAMVVAAFVVMVAASRLYKSAGCSGDGSEECRRLRFGVGLGAASGIVAVIWIFVGRCLPILVDAILSVLMLVAWILGIIFITFGDAAPAQNAGNLYFFTWAAFIVMCWHSSFAFNEACCRKGETTEEAAEEDVEKGEDKAAEEDVEKGEDKAAKEEEVEEEGEDAAAATATAEEEK